ncbi:Mediator of RNA polymerase II transcription subunit 14 [Camponotus floridanus]|uniref:Mediator of RNA polymerase II transcription subunit 14 n=1 Tax=Camponotus floridanus TaxID=104421 RepID=E2A9I0_CAMFO|nr:Mediator of RNA polymerase II transcription subunit 14 [Camponotus floridanus]
MAPVPLEDHQTPVTNNIPQEGNRGGSISLGMLIDFIIQRTYHELTVLAELLPRKTDMERKIEIYNFSARTRQLYVRLLALVKWANSASKVDKSTVRYIFYIYIRVARSPIFNRSLLYLEQISYLL